MALAYITDYSQAKYIPVMDGKINLYLIFINFDTLIGMQWRKYFSLCIQYNFHAAAHTFFQAAYMSLFLVPRGNLSPTVDFVFVFNSVKLVKFRCPWVLRSANIEIINERLRVREWREDLSDIKSNQLTRPNLLWRDPRPGPIEAGRRIALPSLRSGQRGHRGRAN